MKTVITDGHVIVNLRKNSIWFVWNTWRSKHLILFDWLSKNSTWITPRDKNIFFNPCDVRLWNKRVSPWHQKLLLPPLAKIHSGRFLCIIIQTLTSAYWKFYPPSMQNSFRGKIFKSFHAVFVVFKSLHFLVLSHSLVDLLVCFGSLSFQNTYLLLNFSGKWANILFKCNLIWCRI